MITGVEICMIVVDSIAALEFYEKFFEIERVEVSNFGPGASEVIFNIFGSRFHLLDENPAQMLVAPKTGDPVPMWVNVAVGDIKKTYEAALEAGCGEVSPITEMEDFGIKNAIFGDPFGYIWMLHQIDKVISHEERMEIFRNRK